jgi:hypothetical protein
VVLATFLPVGDLRISCRRWKVRDGMNNAWYRLTALKLFPAITHPRVFVSHWRSEEQCTCSDHYSSWCERTGYSSGISVADFLWRNK